MIIDSIEKMRDYTSMIPVLSQVYHAISTTDFLQMETGRLDIDEDLFINIASGETKELEQTVWEAHRKFIDIHIVLYGREMIQYACQNDVTEIKDYEEEMDCQFFDNSYSGIGLLMHPGLFALFFPQDCHRPWICVEKSERIKKLIVKIGMQYVKQVNG